MSGTDKTQVVIAGGGVAAIEAILALEDVARDRVTVTVVTPKPSFELRALAVPAPFARGRERRHFSLLPLIDRCGATLVQDALARVAADAKHVITAKGDTVTYDSLVVATGGIARSAFAGATTFGAEPLILSGLLADIEEGYSRRVAFIVPSSVTWPLPAYELALMTRGQARSMGMNPQITIVTPEAAPLAIFGPAASEDVSDLLRTADIEIRAGEHATVGPSGRVGLQPSGDILDFQRIVALPEIDGPRIDGLPQDENGFVPIDGHTRVIGLRDVYCVGDAADYPIKQGGLATQQADAAALHIAALAGAEVRATPFRPVLRGRLMTGGAEQFFVKHVKRPSTLVSDSPLWWPPTKVSGRYLTRWIAEQDPSALPAEPPAGSTPIEREIPADPTAARRAVLSLTPLGAPIPVHRL